MTPIDRLILHETWVLMVVTSHPGYCDITSRLPDDVTMNGDLTMDHGQMGTSGFLMMSHHVIAHPGYQTDIGVITPTLTAEC